MTTSLIAAYSVSILLMIILPVILPVLWRRRIQVPWLLFCAGMLTFTVSQIVHLPLNKWLSNLGILGQPGVENSPPLWQIALVLGLTAGICEELARAGGYLLMRRVRSPFEGVMVGLGHGGIEAMVFGGVLTAATLSSLAPLIGQDLTQLGLSPVQLSALEAQLTAFTSSPLFAIFPLLERLVAISIHVVFSLLVLQAFRKKNPGYLILAIVYHALVDAAAVYFVQQIKNPLLTELAFTLACVPGWIWALWMLRGEGLFRLSPHAAPVQKELKILWLAFRKEILQQWRTRRLLAIVAAFGVFGMTSPLLAYFMPEMFKAIPGAEQFAGMIPTPTQADALGQYVKNISQFGFLLAILLGMSDVAGEKERGTASMILSKPMPRWAFITSKFLAQLAAFLIGFVIAWVGGYFYTLFLFEPSDPLLMANQFVWINLLLFAWLSVYVTITLISSVLAPSTSAAGGIAVVGAVLMMVGGTVPQVSYLLPGALTSWANQLALAAEVPFNGGALAISIVIALVGLVISIAFFEHQEFA